MGFYLPPAVALVLLLAGYPLAVRCSREEPGQRIALALLAGLAIELFVVATVNLFVPLRGIAAWLCLAPALSPLLHPATLRQLAAEARALLGRPQTAVVAGS